MACAVPFFDYSVNGIGLKIKLLMPYDKEFKTDKQKVVIYQFGVPGVYPSVPIESLKLKCVINRSLLFQPSYFNV